MSSHELAEFSRSRRTGQFGTPHEHHASLGSTNDRALAWCAEGASHGALVTADEQSHGRGRRGRVWASPPGVDLYASLILAPPVPLHEIGGLGLAVAVGIREGLLPHVRGGVDLKWPNDVLVDGRKIAGVLCESRWSGSQARIVAGFGINVRRRIFSPDLVGSATSVALVNDHKGGSRAQILGDVLDAMQPTLDAFFRGGFAAIRERYEPHCVVLGRRILVQDRDDEPMRPAVAHALDTDGALRIRSEDGERRLETGDVWLFPGKPG